MLSIDTVYTVLREFSGLKVDPHPTSMGRLQPGQPSELGAGSTECQPVSSGLSV